ncbi:putative lipid kinase BmrU [Paraliobacillus ryukyuensis]|uniref:YegS/Rv2252/BmrU family lipid kinase n=1 Tax=Paraliobacillus ryukyuensis TaxID=200904 RepID=A0A366E999_9BACI|nr:diacylglycerol kinase family protein [Paraliobacillus ryukyuensis]RBO97988.1 YegS/Rv2252/BmrU family lipid kinase [Paraliobacillus ryukyuensis]
MERVAVILNPLAGNGKLNNIKDQVERILEDTFSEVTIYQTTDAGDGATYVKQVANQVDLIVAAGGDGTIHEVINALAPLPARPAFAIIPGGTSNDFSREIGMLQQPLKAAQQITNKKTKWIDVGQSNDHYFLNFWGIGLITQVSETVDNNSKQNMGRLAYYLRTIQTLGKRRSFHIDLSTPDYEITDDAVMVIVGNGSYTGGIRAFFPEANIEDGLLDVLIIKEASLQAFWSMLQSRVGIEDGYPEGIIALQASEIRIDATPKQAIDCDGERGSVTPSTISVLPKHIEMVIG